MGSELHEAVPAAVHCDFRNERFPLWGGPEPNVCNISTDSDYNSSATHLSKDSLYMQFPQLLNACHAESCKLF